MAILGLLATAINTFNTFPLSFSYPSALISRSRWCRKVLLNQRPSWLATQRSGGRLGGCWTYHQTTEALQFHWRIGKFGQDTWFYGAFSWVTFVAATGWCFFLLRVRMYTALLHQKNESDWMRLKMEGWGVILKNGMFSFTGAYDITNAQVPCKVGQATFVRYSVRVLPEIIHPWRHTYSIIPVSLFIPTKPLPYQKVKDRHSVVGPTSHPFGVDSVDQGTWRVCGICRVQGQKTGPQRPTFAMRVYGILMEYC